MRIRRLDAIGVSDANETAIRSAPPDLDNVARCSGVYGCIFSACYIDAVMMAAPAAHRVGTPTEPRNHRSPVDHLLHVHPNSRGVFWLDGGGRSRIACRRAASESQHSDKG
jgi:hypothetical protein